MGKVRYGARTTVVSPSPNGTSCVGPPGHRTRTTRAVAGRASTTVGDDIDQYPLPAAISRIGPS